MREINVLSIVATKFSICHSDGLVALKKVAEKSFGITQFSGGALTFDERTGLPVLRFNATGRTGHWGYTTIAIPKTVVGTGLTPFVIVNGAMIGPANGVYSQDQENYYIWLFIHFSTDAIEVNFTGAPPSTTTSLTSSGTSIDGTTTTSGQSTTTGATSSNAQGTAIETTATSGHGDPAQTWPATDLLVGGLAIFSLIVVGIVIAVLKRNRTTKAE